MVDIVHQATLFCFVVDEEMYQGRQRYCEIPFRNFMDKHGKETEKEYLKHIQDTKRYGAGVGSANQKVNLALQKEQDEQDKKLLEMKEDEEENAEIEEQVGLSEINPKEGNMSGGKLTRKPSGFTKAGTIHMDVTQNESLIKTQKGETTFLDLALDKANQSNGKSTTSLKTIKKVDDDTNKIDDSKKGDET